MDMAAIALLYLGTPYVWGGNDITTGVDCSGFVCEVSRSVGLLDKRDLTAAQLYTWYMNYNCSSEISKNSILFFGKSTFEITHVGIAISSYQYIEAGGEGRVNTDKGYVRVRPINWRRDLVAALKVNE